MTAFHEQKACLRCNDVEIEIDARGGVEADDGGDAIDLTITLHRDGQSVTMRVPREQWRAFVRAVGRLR